AEGWWSPYGRDIPHMLFSLSKSFTSTAVGLAVTEGYFSVEDPVLAYFPDETPAEVNDFLAAMRVRHLLSMSTGHAEDTFPPMIEHADGHWTQAFFEVPVLHEPGTHFLYNTGATYMLSAIVQKTTGQKLIDYLQPRLFAPLGIENPTWQESPQGINTGGTGLNVKTEDIARFGQLYLQKGLWQGQRILPEAWIAEATAFQVANGDDPASDWAQGYGYQFWRCRHDHYRGDGAFGQYCIVMPAQDAVLAMTSGLPDMQLPLNLVWDKLLPAMRPDALPEDAAAQAALAKKVSSLGMTPVQGQAEVPLAAQVSGRTYTVEANPLGIETITLHFAGSACTVDIHTTSAEETIVCGSGAWQRGQTGLFHESRLVDSQRITTSGAWTAEDTFTMLIRFYETPFYQTVVCQFAGDDLTVEIKVNVGFGNPEPVTLVAHRAG
ncbi:MAG: beta-lactamase family protein, partial [Anaerolineae bacterium]|nr:beta-lactamase family protein [Anaerolineae bacterium]